MKKNSILLLALILLVAPTLDASSIQESSVAVTEVQEETTTQNIEGSVETGSEEIIAEESITIEESVVSEEKPVVIEENESEEVIVEESTILEESVVSEEDVYSTQEEELITITNPVLKSSRTNEDTEILVSNDSDPVDVSTSESKSQAGINTIKFSSNVRTNLSGEFYVSNQGIISATSSSNANKIVLENGVITSIDRGLVRTNGGKSDTDIMYLTLEDAYNKENPIPISGAGYEGLYVSNQTYMDSSYIEFKMSGVSAFMPLDELTLIPSNLVKAQSYYNVENGEWIFNEAVDSLMSDEYYSYAVGLAPEWAVEGSKYYTYDNYNYSTNPYAMQRASLTGANYYQNLPFRSTSEYTASDYQKFLAYKGKTGSQYYNSTQAFVDAENLEFINSTLLFAFANHESAYGMSTYSKRCNNFFGRGAFDSNPDNACIEYGFTTARDGILSQAIFLNNSYLDSYDWRYFGGYFGNKSGGMNVKYATDPNWGNANGGHAYALDSYYGNKEVSDYKIARVATDKTIYKNSSLTTPFKMYAGACSTSSTCNFSIGGNTGSTVLENVIIRSSGNGYYQIQLPTQSNLTSSSTCTSSYADKGSYPNYNSANKYTISVNPGDVGFACDYGSFTKQVGYIASSGVTILNDGTGLIPGANELTAISEYGSDGKLKFKVFVDRNNNVKYTAEYNSSGKIIKYYEYYPNTKYGSHGKHIRLVFSVNSGGYIYKASEQLDNNGQKIKYYEYYSNATYKSHSNRIKYVFNVNSSGNVTNAYKLSDNIQKTLAYYEYYSNAKYGNHSKRVRYIFDVNTNGYVYKASQLSDNVQRVTTYYEYYGNAKYGSHSKRIKYVFNINSSGYVTSARYLSDNSQKVLKYYEYYGNTRYGSHSKRIKYIFSVNSSGYLTYATSLSDNSQKVLNYYEYYSNTKYGNHSSHLKYVFYLDDAGYIRFTNEYKNGVKNPYKRYYYDYHTKYGSHSDNISYYIYL